MYIYICACMLISTYMYDICISTYIYIEREIRNMCI